VSSPRKSPFEPGLSSWGTVLVALLRVIGELAVQAAQLVLFTVRREKWRREIRSLVARDPLPTTAAGGSRSPRVAGVCLALIGACALLGGCAQQKIGTKSSWQLFTDERSSAPQRLSETMSLLEGNNDWSDVAVTTRLFRGDEQKSGFVVIGEDLRRTFAPPFNFEELRDTFRLLR